MPSTFKLRAHLLGNPYHPFPLLKPLRPLRMMIKTAATNKKTVWIKTSEKECITTALEVGLSDTILIDANDDHASANLNAWRQLGRINVVTAQPQGALIDDAGFRIGRIERLLDASDLSAAMDTITAAAASDASTDGGIVIMDAADWQIIPAENLVAAFQSLSGTLLAVAKTASDSQVMLEALEIGTDGVVLQTSDPGEIRALATFLNSRDAQGQESLKYEVARVKEVRPVGSGDRVCVDLATNMIPGEGLLVGSFARGMFLVHSECEESGYINSRPFRINAGPVRLKRPEIKSSLFLDIREYMCLFTCHFTPNKPICITKNLPNNKIGIFFLSSFLISPFFCTTGPCICPDSRWKDWLPGRTRQWLRSGSCRRSRTKKT